MSLENELAPEDLKELTINDMAEAAGVNRRSLAVWLRRDLKLRPARQEVIEGKTVNYYGRSTLALVLAMITSKKERKDARALASKGRRPVKAAA